MLEHMHTYTHMMLEDVLQNWFSYNITVEYTDIIYCSIAISNLQLYLADLHILILFNLPASLGSTAHSLGRLPLTMHCVSYSLGLNLFKDVLGVSKANARGRLRH